MKQKLLILFAALLCSMTMFADGIKIGKLYYDIGNYDGNDPTALSAAVIPTEGEPYSGDIVIPASVKYNGVTYAVTYISDDAFANSTGLASVQIPNSVQVVGLAAFYHCTSLTSVTMGTGVRGIQESAFEACTALTDVSIESNTVTFGHYVFRECTSLPVVDGIRYAGPYLVEVVDFAEDDYYTVREGTKWIGEYAFCARYLFASDPTPFDYLGIYNKNFRSIEVYLPSTLKGIGDFAFYGCIIFGSLPSGLTTIGQYAFSHSDRPWGNIIPTSVTQIGDCAFIGLEIHYDGTAPGAPWGARYVHTNKKVYTEYVESTQTLTYYFDVNWESRTGVIEFYDLTGENVRFKEYHDKVKKAVIDPSMKSTTYYGDYSFTSTDNLFYGGSDSEGDYTLSAMTTIEGLEYLNVLVWVKSMTKMFYGCSSLKTLDLRSWGMVYHLKNTNGMFQGCTNLKTIYMFSIDNYWNGAQTNIEDMSYMFADCPKLKSIHCYLDWNDLFTGQSDNMFRGCTSLVGEKGTAFNSSMTDKTYARPDDPENGKPGYFTTTTEDPAFEEIYTEYDAATQTLTYYYDDERESRSGVTELYAPNTTRFADYYNKVQKAVIDKSMQNAPLTSMEKMFYGGFSMKPLYLSKMTSIEGLENLNTSDVTSMQSMFEGCQSLTELDLSTFNTANVTNTNCMFQSCSNLETLNIALFNIGKMEDMRYMFSGCSKLKTIYCNSDWSTSGAQSSYMFSGCSALEGGQGTKFNSSVIDKSYARTDDPDNDKPGYFTVVESVAVTISAMEWATFVAPYALDFSDVDGLTAYIITGHTGSTVETVEVSDVPANTPVLLNGSANTYTIPVITGSATDVSGNMLVAGTGAKVSAEAGKTKYVLSTEADDVVFKIITETPATVAKSKAYLMFDEVVESRQLTFGHDVTGIESSPESSFEGKNLWYDLQGRRLEGMPTRKGLYIVNGKKYLVK